MNILTIFYYRSAEEAARKTWIIKSLVLIVFFVTVLFGCNASEPDPTSTEPVTPVLDVQIYTDSIPGAAVVYSDLSFSWSNTATDESGSSNVIVYTFCTPDIWSDCSSSKAVIPLTDGANDIYFYGGDASYNETIVYTDNGPPDVDGHSSDISLGMSQWPTEVKVYFNKLMDPDTINGGTFYVMNAAGNIVANYVEVDDDKDSAKINMSGQPDEIYTAVITTGVTDYWGTPMSVEYTWDFEFSCGWAVYMGYPCP